jgi:hypothetical protein
MAKMSYQPAGLSPMVWKPFGIPKPSVWSILLKFPCFEPPPSQNLWFPLLNRRYTKTIQIPIFAVLGHFSHFGLFPAYQNRQFPLLNRRYTKTIQIPILAVLGRFSHFGLFPAFLAVLDRFSCSDSDLTNFPFLKEAVCTSKGCIMTWRSLLLWQNNLLLRLALIRAQERLKLKKKLNPREIVRSSRKELSAFSS